MAFFFLFLFVTYFSVLSFSASFSYVIFLAYVMLQARIILHLLTWTLCYHSRVLSNIYLNIGVKKHKGIS